MLFLKNLALQYALPTAFVAVLPLIWADSGASASWEFWAVPDGFHRQLLVPTALLALVILVQTLWLERKVAGAEGGEVVVPHGRSGWMFVLVLAVFLLRAFEYNDIFPVYHFGETNSAINGARLVADELAAGTFDPFRRYNLGFGPLFYPVFSVVGYTFPMARTLTILTWGLALLSFLVLFSAMHRRANHPLILVPPVLLSMILPSLRAYTWHAGAMLASVAAFFVLAGVLGRWTLRARVGAVAVGLCLFSVALLAYHAVVLYIPLVAAVVVLSGLFGWRPDRPARIALVTCLVVAAFALGIVWSAGGENSVPFHNRIAFELGDERPNWNKSDNLLRSWDNLFYSFFWHDSSVPVRILFLSGVCASLRFARTWLFARICLVFLVGLSIPQSFLWGRSDWSQNCYTIVPVMGILLVGLLRLTRTLALIRPAPAYAAACVTVLATVCGLEYRQYFSAGMFFDRHYDQHPYDTGLQLSLALRNAHESAGDTTDRVFFMPALDEPQLPVSYDTYGLQWRSPSKRRVLRDVRFFTSPDDLARQVREIQARSDRAVRVYFGISGPEAYAVLEQYLAKLPPNAAVVAHEPYKALVAPHLSLIVTYVDIPSAG